MFITGLVFIIVFFFILIMAVIESALFLHSIQSSWIGIPTIRTRFKDLDFLLQKEKITREDVVYDLGSGLGQTLFYIETETSAQTVGFEMNAVSFLVSWFAAKFQALRTKIYMSDFLKADLREATIVYTYLSKEKMIELEEALPPRLTQGTRLISCDFPFPTLIPLRTHKASHHTFYVYEF